MKGDFNERETNELLCILTDLRGTADQAAQVLVKLGFAQGQAQGAGRPVIGPDGKPIITPKHIAAQAAGQMANILDATLHNIRGLCAMLLALCQQVEQRATTPQSPDRNGAPIPFPDSNVRPSGLIVEKAGKAE